jgi:hypothetical protein
VAGKGAGSASKTYNLRITRVKYTAAPCSLNEPTNDSYTTPTPLVLGTAKPYAFCESPDTDWVKFTALAGKTYKIEANPVSPKVDIAVDAYSFNGTTYTYLGTFDSGFSGGAEGDNYTNATAGNLTILLAYYDYYGHYGSTNTYSAKVTQQ